MLNNPEQPGMENPLPFLIEPLRAAPTTLPRKQVSSTSSDSGFSCLHVLSPEMPVTPDDSQPNLMPSTLQINRPRGPLTPIQQFRYNIRKSKKRP